MSYDPIFVQATNNRFTKSGIYQNSSSNLKNYKINDGKNIRNKHRNSFDREFNDPNFAQFANEAYASRDGYAIRLNPATGRKEMFVAGTRDLNDWILNTADMMLYSGDALLTEQAKKMAPWRDQKRIKFLEKLDYPRVEQTRYFEEIARKENVSRIYGHSRGGAIVSDMDTDASKIGLDAAMIIASNKDTVNFYEGENYLYTGLFDYAIGYTGTHNVHYNHSLSPHKVWKSHSGKDN